MDSQKKTGFCLTLTFTAFVETRTVVHYSLTLKPKLVVLRDGTVS